MTIAHLSDTHLGFRNYSRISPEGYNQREVDIMRCFEECLDAIAERDPDLVVHSGDFFDVVRPSNYSIVHAYRALSRFQERRGGRPFLLIAGNHETPRTLEAGNILALFRDIAGMQVFIGASEEENRAEIADLDLEVLAVPTDMLEARQASFRPRTRRPNRVLVLHGMERGVIPQGGDFDIDETHRGDWTYVALGDYHVFKKFGPNCCYAGSPDYASSNIWEESRSAKGWVWYDSTFDAVELVPSNPRPVVDLPLIHAREMSGEEITQRMLEQARWNEVPLPIVRQRVVDVHPESRADVGFARLRELQERCFHYSYSLAPYIPGLSGDHDDAGGAAEVMAAVTLEEEWKRHVEGILCPPAVERERVLGLGLDMLRGAAGEADQPAA